MDNEHASDRPKAYSYIRMSTDLQQKGDSLRRQLEASREYAEKHGLELVEDFDLNDIGVSAYRGKNLSSGRFGRFIDAVREGAVLKGSYLLVESMDRMSRQAPAKALQPFLEVINSGIVLVTMNPLEVFTEQTLDFYRLLMALTVMQRSHEESDIKSHRLRSAWANKRTRAASKKLTARCPGWLRLNADRTEFEVIEESAAIVRRIFEEAASGLGTYSIVRRLNEAGVPTFTGKAGWQKGTVNKILSSAAAIGTFQPKRCEDGKRTPEGDPIANYFPRIVSVDLFEAAQRGRLERKTMPDAGRKGGGGPKGKNFTNLFSKLARCDYCGEPMHYQNKGRPRGQTYLVCSSAVRKGGCDRTSGWRYDDFETTFLTFVEQLDLGSLVSSSEHSNRRSDLAVRLEAVQGKIKLIEEKLRRMFETNMEMGEFKSEFLAAAIRKSEQEIANAKKQEQQLRHEIAILDQTALTYYKRPDQVAKLIERVRSRRGGDVYKLRAQISSRLQSLIKELRLTVDEGDHHFEVVFRDGSGMMLFVDPEDPTKFVQKVSGRAPNFELVEDGRSVQMPNDGLAAGEVGLD
jgi:DNA invertase Pin-like site-specific DNA recombinase